MKRPAFQWYPGDARRDTALQACSLPARGLWREMLDLTHAGAIRLERTDGAVTISIVRILERRVQTEILALSREEFHALAELFTEAAA